MYDNGFLIDGNWRYLDFYDLDIEEQGKILREAHKEISMEIEIGEETLQAIFKVFSRIISEKYLV